MIRRPPRSTQSRSSAATDVYKRQPGTLDEVRGTPDEVPGTLDKGPETPDLSLIHISEPTRLGMDLVCRLLLEKKTNPHPLNPQQLNTSSPTNTTQSPQQ